MKGIITKRIVIAVLAALTVLGATDVWAQKPRLHRRTTHRRVVPKKPVEPMYSVATGTVFRARMNDSLSSKTARVGDRFTATVTEPVYSSNGVVVVPVGATLNGRVSEVRPANKRGEPGQLGMSFYSLRLPNGRTHVINGSLSDLEDGKATADNEGGVSARKMNNRKLIFIGGGAAGGAILGGAFGGGKGAAIGALLGAAGGFAGDRLTKGSEAQVKPGTTFGVYLNQPISLPRFAETTPVTP